MKFFETKFLDTADKFLSELDPKIVRKVLYNIIWQNRHMIQNS